MTLSVEYPAPPDAVTTPRLELIDGGNWEAFIAAPYAVLMLSKTSCPACQQWTEELSAFLAHDQQWTVVRFGKMLLDRPGLTSFKRGNPWLAEVDVLPYHIIYAQGQRVKTFPGGGLERLLNRLQIVTSQNADPG